MLPMSSMAMAATTFVSQNVGAKKTDRVRKGTFTALAMTITVTTVVVTILCIFADSFMRLFTQDPSVIDFGVLFLRANNFFLIFNCINHVLAGALRGQGDSKGPMIVMLMSFVAIRQVYLFAVTRFIANTPFLVGFGYPVGWMCCCALEVLYYLRWKKRVVVS